MLGAMPSLVLPSVMRKALVGWWPCNEGSGSAITDRSGNGMNGTTSGTTVSWVKSGRYGWALSLVGSNAMVTIPDNALLDQVSGMTITARLYMLSPFVANMGIFSKSTGSGATNTPYDFRCGSGTGSEPPAGALIFISANSSFCIFKNTVALMADAWNTAGVRKADGYVQDAPTFLRNDVTVTGTYATGSGTGLANANANAALIGDRNDGYLSQKAYYSDLRLYSAALTNNQMKAVHYGRG